MQDGLLIRIKKQALQARGQFLLVRDQSKISLLSLRSLSFISFSYKDESRAFIMDQPSAYR